MSIHLNSGHDTETASQMMTAMESAGGIPGVRVTVSGPQPTATSIPVKWDGITFVNNITYSDKGMKVWIIYEVGDGKVLPWIKNKVAVFFLI